MESMLCLSIALHLLCLGSSVLRKGLLEYHDPSFTVALLKALQTIRGVAAASPQLLCCDWSICNPCAMALYVADADPLALIL